MPALQGPGANVKTRVSAQAKARLAAFAIAATITVLYAGPKSPIPIMKAPTLVTKSGCTCGRQDRRAWDVHGELPESRAATAERGPGCTEVGADLNGPRSTLVTCLGCRGGGVNRIGSPPAVTLQLLF